jgi:hypothetical protein
VVVALVVEGRQYRAGPCEFLHALDEPHRCRVGRMTPVELLAPGQRLPPTGELTEGRGTAKIESSRFLMDDNYGQFLFNFTGSLN